MGGVGGGVGAVNTGLGFPTAQMSTEGKTLLSSLTAQLSMNGCRVGSWWPAMSAPAASARQLTMTKIWVATDTRLFSLARGDASCVFLSSVRVTQPRSTRACARACACVHVCVVQLSVRSFTRSAGRKLRFVYTPPGLRLRVAL